MQLLQYTHLSSAVLASSSWNFFLQIRYKKPFFPLTTTSFVAPTPKKGPTLPSNLSFSVDSISIWAFWGGRHILRHHFFLFFLSFFFVTFLFFPISPIIRLFLCKLSALLWCKLSVWWVDVSSCACCLFLLWEGCYLIKTLPLSWRTKTFSCSLSSQFASWFYLHFRTRYRTTVTYIS